MADKEQEETCCKNSDEEENDREKFEKKEHRLGIDGWDLYRKGKISMNPVRRYCTILDQDYKKNKVTVCAHLTNLYNSFQITYGNKVGAKDVNFFDLDKWNSKYEEPEDKDQ